MAAVAAVAVMLLVGTLWSLASLCQRVADAEWERDKLLREHAAALATARREGAEEMRERCAAAMLATNTLPAWESWQSALDAIRALPLDRDGGTP